MKINSLPNRVSTYRAAGLEARWTKHHGTPFIVVRNPSAKLQHQRENWWLVDRRMYASMQKLGILDGFYSQTALGDIFFI